jgi:hypothetical protein
LGRIGLAAAVVAGFVLAAPPARAQTPAPADGGYTLGSGVRLGSSGVRLGGYLATDWEKAKGEDAVFTFDDLSLFVFGDIGARMRFFVEVEDSKFWRVAGGRSEVIHHGDVERLYIDYLHSDLLKIRVGKFLTPVGTWNEIHPDPLTWTVSRPLASYATFPAFTSGVEASGTVAGDSLDVDYHAYVQANPCLQCSTGDRQTERMVGGRVRVRRDRLEIGVPVLHYVDRLSHDSVTLTGVDLLAKAGALEARGEATFGRVIRESRADADAEYAYYLQGLYALTERHFIVARQERARSRDGDTWTGWTVGGLYRPHPAVSLKLEFQAATGRFPVGEAGTGNRVLAGFGVLF